ncbi:FAD-dependent oxidoreductase [Arthrobacter sp. LjRoot78]|uniref:NAD(P)/FAD-dependent oxidoreductase n=1 Tax=Arthrobacter sp. LjRoot78 TaxID=3342338 RepID=UPI003ECF5FEE
MAVVIIGAGHAGLQVADSLRSAGYAAKITVVSDEPGLPYQRPPLSKDYLLPGKKPLPLPLRAASFFTEKDVALQEAGAVAVNRETRTVTLADNAVLAYDWLVLATGARTRGLQCPGAQLPGIHSLKRLSDAEALHAALPLARHVVVIGAGFIGLEFAAAARAHGCSVTVLEHGPRPMGRALTRPTADWFAAAHRELGVDLRLGEGITAFEPGPDGRVAAAISTTGATYAADLVVVGIGVTPNDGLAAECGLQTDNGVVVDEALRTSDPAILSVGDCANFPNIHTGTRTRLESIQNATDQARSAAHTIVGREDPYVDLPWFWSIQGPHRLQIAGLSDPADDTVTAGDLGGAKFSTLCFRYGRLVAVESVNSPADHGAARRLLAAGQGPTKEAAEREGFSLRQFAEETRSAAPAGAR